MSKVITQNKHFIYDRPEKLNLKYVIKKCIDLLGYIYYGLLERLLKPCLNECRNEKKFRIAICAIFKNEAKYLKEWIEFHQIVGVDHFYLYNNNSSDDFLTVLKPYIEQGLVTLTNFPYDQAQLKAYFDCASKYRFEAEWIGFIDIDEMIIPNSTDNIYDFLKKFSNRPAVCIYWKLFGTSGLYERCKNSGSNNLITEDFIVAWPKYMDVGKCFWNTKYPIHTDIKHNRGMIHRTVANIHGIDLPPVNCFGQILLFNNHRAPFTANANNFPIQINHYFTKSYREYLEKASRGDAFFKINPHNIEYFFYHEMKCSSPDYHAYKYLIKLKIAMKEGRTTENDTNDKKEL